MPRKPYINNRIQQTQHCHQKTSVDICCFTYQFPHKQQRNICAHQSQKMRDPVQICNPKFPGCQEDPVQQYCNRMIMGITLKIKIIKIRRDMSALLHMPCLIKDQQIIISHPVSYIIQIQQLQYQQQQKNSSCSLQKSLFAPGTAEICQFHKQQQQKQASCQEHQEHVFVFKYVFCLRDSTRRMNQNPSQTSQKQQRSHIQDSFSHDLYHFRLLLMCFSCLSYYKTTSYSTTFFCCEKFQSTYVCHLYKL